jgi:hypothetical protein
VNKKQLEEQNFGEDRQWKMKLERDNSEAQYTASDHGEIMLPECFSSPQLPTGIPASI